MEDKNKIWGVSPLRTIYVTAPESRRRELFSTLERFAEINGFRSRISGIDRDKPQYGIDMLRSDIRLAGDNILDLRVFRISFYANARSDSDYDRQSKLAVADPLLNDLLQRLERVSGIEVSQTK